VRIDTEKNQGMILRIQRMSTEDGPGIRSTVFFKGCPLRCAWCHNPESISPKPQVHWVKSRCIGCKSCVEACTEGALAATDSGIIIDRAKCTSCGDCAKACPSTAMEVYGEVLSLDDLVREVLKDKVYFEKSGGGVTLSGGEPTLQSHFAKPLLSSLKENGIHTALDTCGQCSWDTLEGLLPHTDLILYDLKLIDWERHKEFTGLTNERILDNLVLLREYMQEHGMPKELWIRTPLIPASTATSENLKAIGAFIKKNVSPLVSRWELCTFNNLCTNKYEGLGINWSFKTSELLAEDETEHLASVAKGSGVDPRIVHVSGLKKRAAQTEAPEQRAHLSIVKGGTCK